MNPPVDWVIALTAAYLIGSIPFGMLAARMRRIDLRNYGSGSTGATNVARTLGMKTGIAVLALDAGKGVAAVLIAKAVSDSAAVASFAALLVIVGHSWSVIVYMLGGRQPPDQTEPGIASRFQRTLRRLQGGKGVATGLGALFIVSPVAGAITFVGLGVVIATRYVSLGSMVGTATGMIVMVVLIAMGRLDAWYLVFALGGSAIIEFRHIANVKRLINGTESRLDLTPRPRRAAKSRGI